MDICSFMAIFTQNCKTHGGDRGEVRGLPTSLGSLGIVGIRIVVEISTLDQSLGLFGQ